MKTILCLLFLKKKDIKEYTPAVFKTNLCSVLLLIFTLSPFFYYIYFSFNQFNVPHDSRQSDCFLNQADFQK